VWLSLLEEERQEFWRFIKTGELANISIQEQNLHPWYCDPISNGLVKDVTESTSILPCTIPEEIPEINSLVPSGNPSPLLANNFIEIVYVYCFCFRLFVGEWIGDLQGDIIECILRISRVLNPTSTSFQAFLSPTATIKSVLDLSVLPPFSNTINFSVEIINDVISVISFKHRSLLLLSHIHQFFGNVYEKQKKHSASWKRLAKITNKLWFYLSWCNSQDSSVFTELKTQLEPLYQKYFFLHFNTKEVKNPTPKILVMKKSNPGFETFVQKNVTPKKIVEEKRKPLIVELDK